MLSANAWIGRITGDARVTGSGDRSADEGDSPDAEESDTKGVHIGGSDEDVEVADVLADDLDGLQFHKADEVDKYLPQGEIEDDDELEDLRLRDTDLLLVALRAGEDASQLELYVYEDDDDDDPNLYLHHETILPAFPLCVSCSHFHPSLGYSRGSIAAVGSFQPTIDVWDLNDVESLEPLLSLGGYVQSSPTPSRKRKHKRHQNLKRTRLELLPDSHTAEVLSVDWNTSHQEYLASGSADSTVKCWDVESGSCVATLYHHGKHVQSVAWCASEDGILLSASFDQMAQVVDARSGSVASTFQLGADAERAVWLNATSFIVTTETGFLSAFDRRASTSSSAHGDKPLWSVRAHRKAASACAVSTQVPGMVMTGSTDKNIKVWDVRGGREAELVAEQSASQCGAVFDLSICEDDEHPFLVSAAGSKGAVTLYDMGVLQDSVASRFGDAVDSTVTTRTQRRAKATVKTQRSKANQDSDDSD